MTNNVNREVNKIKSVFKSLGNVVLTLGIGKVIKDSVQSAIQVESAIYQIKRTMQESSNQFLKWANTQAAAYGMGKAEALKYGAIYSNLISGFSKDAAETTRRTQDLIKASAIVASATGRTMEDTMERIRSGLLGNTEAIEDLGINVNVAMIQSTEAFKRFANGKSWDQLNFQTQQQIRLMAILEQANIKYGDSLANTSATQMMMFRAELSNLKLALGEAFMPIVTTVLPILTSFVSYLASVTNTVAQFMQVLFGKTIGVDQKNTIANTNQSAAANDKLAGSYDKIGKSAKKANGSLAGFDEVNNLNDDKGADGDGAGADGGNGGMTVQPLNTSGFDSSVGVIPESVRVAAETVKGIIGDVTGFIESNKEIILSVIGGIIAGFATFQTLTFLSNIPIMLEGIGLALSVLLTPIGVASMAVGGLVAAFLYLYQTNEKFRNDINVVWSDIGKIFTSFWNDTLKPIVGYIGNDFIKPIVGSFKDNMLPVLADIFVGVGKIFGDFVALLQSTINNLWGILRPALDLTKNIIIDFLEIIKTLWDKYGQTLIENIREFIQGVQETMQLLWDNVLNPIIQPFLEMLSWLWDSHLKGLVQQVGEFVMKCINGALELYNGFIKPLIDWMIVSLGPAMSTSITFIVNLFGTMLAGISDTIKGLFKILGGIIDFITGVFTGNWSKAWQGVKDIFGGIFDSLVGLVKVPLNYIIDAINFVIDGLNHINIDIPDWDILPDNIQGKKFGVNISHIPKLATGGITDVNNPFLAVVGDNRSQREVVSPLDDLMGMITSAVGTAMLSAMEFNQPSNSNSNTGDIVFQLDGTTFGRIIKPYIDQEKNRVGQSMIIQST